MEGVCKPNLLSCWAPRSQNLGQASSSEVGYPAPLCLCSLKMAFSTTGKWTSTKRGALEGGRHHPPSTRKYRLPLLPAAHPPASGDTWSFLSLEQYPTHSPPGEAHSSPPSPGLPRAGGSQALEDVRILLSQTKSHTACRPGTTESPLHPDHVSFPLSCYSLLSWNSFQVWFFHFACLAQWC